MGEISATMFAPKTVSNILTEVSTIDDLLMKSTRLDFYVRLLEDEMRKIDGFKRELPYCMFLVQDAIEILAEESLKWKGKHMEAVILEQFVPMKKNDDALENIGVKKSDEFVEKKNWLSSAQLWNNFQHENPDSESVKYQHGEETCIGKQVQGCLFQSKGGAFVPFKKPSIQMEAIKASAPRLPVHDAILLPFSDDDMEPLDLNLKKDASGFVRPQMHEMYHNQQHKKQRRCWSPELHQLFVDALHKLGGDKSATPKMIRELMKVDGLTNDEVKSHLQKYRLHIKKRPSSSIGGSTMIPSWLSNTQFGNSNKTGGSGSPQSPFLNGSSPMKVRSNTAGESIDE